MQVTPSPSVEETSQQPVAAVKQATIDGNQAVAHVAYRTNEVIAIYPITPASGMGEWSDQWSASRVQNIWGSIPHVIEMQSEAGAAGSLHGALQTGSLATTFTASQGLLLMIPNMYKIAGELTPAVIHVAARSVAAQALSIFGDHSDVMAARATGFAMLASGSVQEAMDMALIAQASTLSSRIPFLHFFDGFRTSHEISKIELVTDKQMGQMLPDELIAAHRSRAMSPERPTIRGTAQNPDVFFQARESVNKYYQACADTTQQAMDKFAELTGRQYKIFDYHGAPDAEQVIVIMGSGAEAVHETVDALNASGKRVGLVKVRLYRPFDTDRFLESLPSTVRAISVLDRTKEPGSPGEPLYLDCVHALRNRQDRFGDMGPIILGGRFGLSSKEFTPAMIQSVFENLSLTQPRNQFTIGIRDDVTNTSLEYDPDYAVEPDSRYRALFYGLGSDGTVGANKNSIKIIGEETDLFAQGYFVYDSKKAGAVTISHLRFGKEPIRSSYLINRANFVACHNPTFLERIDMLDRVQPGGSFLLNTKEPPETVWDSLPGSVQRQIIEKDLSFFVIDAYRQARECGMGGRVNTIMQTCFFSITSILPNDEAIAAIKREITKTYGSKGEEIVQMNLQAVDRATEHLHQVKVPKAVSRTDELAFPVSSEAPDFVRNVTACMIAGQGDALPVSALPGDGTYPVGTTKWEKRNLALDIPVWEPDLCIQCGKCAMVCPHAVIRIKAYEPELLEHAPASFKSSDGQDRAWSELKYTIQVAPEDCTGCAICVDVCPAKDKSQTARKALNMRPQPPLRDQEKENWDFFLTIPELQRNLIEPGKIRQQQVQQPLFEFSSACAGCGETPYIKLATQLFGDRMIVANATGCSSIYGGNLPTTPWSTDAQGRGPTWSNSLFEDNAEFGLGMKIAVDQQREFALMLLRKLAADIGDELVRGIAQSVQTDEAEIYEQRRRVEELKSKLQAIHTEEAQSLLNVADALVKKSVWIIGGDGWAYDIGYGGLDHVLASGKDVNILVLDTEVYSNTGGQMSKSTPRAAVAKFAASGKPAGKKDLGLMATTYGTAYVASVAMGARDEHTLRTFLEAESYPGPSLIIAYSHCIAHGIHMETAMHNQKAAVQSGQWMLYRYDPRRVAEGQNPFQLDSRKPKINVKDYMLMENRFKMLIKSHPDDARRLFKEAQRDADQRYQHYALLAGLTGNQKEVKP